MSVLRRLDTAGFDPAPWTNGGGVTTQIDRDLDEPWRWRLSLAKIERDGPFSPLPGVRRQFVALDGALELTIAGQVQHVPRLHPIAFEGATAPQARLIDGPTRAFNLMLRNPAQGELIARPLLGTMLLLPDAGERWFAYLTSGRATAHGSRDDETLAAGEMAWIATAPGQRLRLEGAGEIVLVRLNV